MKALITMEDGNDFEKGGLVSIVIDSNGHIQMESCDGSMQTISPNDYEKIVVEQESDVLRCTNCGQECFDDASPEVVFSDKKNIICEECSIDFEMIGDKVVKRKINI